jgi:hypothetical protein
MIIGQTLHAGTTAYSPWFGRGGDVGEFTCEIIDTTANVNVAITIETKNSEDIDSAAVPPSSGATFSAISAGLKKTSALGFKELVRFKYTISFDTGGSIVDYVHLRMLYPQWQPN